MEPEVDVDQFRFGVRLGEIAGFRGSCRPSLLMVDHSGTYSSARRHYIRKTRHHRYRALATDLAPVVKAYRSLQELGMNNWSELDAGARKEIMRWKHTLMDLYWHAAPEKLKASAIERYYRARYQRRMAYPFVASVFAQGMWGIMRRGSVNPLLLMAFLLCLWIILVLTELFVTIRRRLSRSEIYDVLEFELIN